LQFPLAAQYLAAFRGLPIEAYKEKALLFTTHKSKVFPPDIAAQELLWAWAIGQAAEKAIPEIRGQLPDDPMAESILKRGAKFFVSSITAQLLSDRNGADYIARTGVGGLFGKAMGDRLVKYAKLATLFYVQIMRGLAKSSADVGTLIRRPETAEHLRDGVKERLVSERLAPDAFEEKLPKLPGIS
jgi:hypothetical protein